MLKLARKISLSGINLFTTYSFRGLSKTSNNSLRFQHLRQFSPKNPLNDLKAFKKSEYYKEFVDFFKKYRLLFFGSAILIFYSSLLKREKIREHKKITNNVI